MCGEVTLVAGRPDVHFRLAGTPKKLVNAVQGKNALILNPTHDRMGNCGTLKQWRKFLSRNGATYVSTSNWCVSGKRKQKPSPTLHSVWHDGKSREPTFKYERESLYYREWMLC
jgi:hypothetical protein